MGIRSSTVIIVVIGIVFPLAVAQRCPAQPRMRQGDIVGGFGKLSWGATVEQARTVYRDLYSGSYVVENGMEEPSRIYYRRDETAEIEGVAFDSIQYWFRANRFYRVRAVMRSGIGPRSLITRSEESFARLRRDLARRYGAPTRYTESYFADFVTVVRVAQWDRADATVVLKYKGPETTNEDELTFELREGGRH